MLFQFSLHRVKKNKAQHNAVFLANYCNIEDWGGGGEGGFKFSTKPEYKLVTQIGNHTQPASVSSCAAIYLSCVHS